jgi:hypothetical protein
MDIDAPAPRRSERIASMPVKKKDVFTPDVTLREKKKRSKSKATKQKTKAFKVNDEFTSIKKRQPRKSTKKTQETVMTLLPKAFEDWKISDLFHLVKKYAITQEQRSFYYSVLQAILKNLKEFGIHNRLSQFKNQRIMIAAFVSQQFGTSFEAIEVVFDAMLNYDELKEAEVSKENQTNTFDNLLGSLITSLNAVKI